MAAPITDLQHTLASRPAIAADAEFRRALFCAEVAAEFAAAGLAGPRAEGLVAMQWHGFSAQLNQPAVEHTTYLLDDEPVAVLATTRHADQVRVVWVAVAAAHRGLGIAGQVLQPVIESAHAAALPVTLHVNPSNTAARALYQRLGFSDVPGGEDPAYLFMRSQPCEPVQNLSPAGSHS